MPISSFANPCHIEYLTDREISRLRDEIIELNVVIDREKHAINKIKHQLEIFYTKYLEEIEQSKYQYEANYIEQIKSFANSAEVRNAHNPIDLKKLYYKLAKDLHPDSSNNKDDIFKTVNAAYKTQNLQELLRLEQALSQIDILANESPLETISRLERQHDNLLNELQSIKEQKNQLLQSSSYRLREDVIRARIQSL